MPDLRPTCLIEDPPETDMPSRDQSETNMPHRRHIGDIHASLKTRRRPTCLIGDPSETEMPDRRPIGD